MISFRRKIFIKLFKTSDLLIISLSLIITYWAVFYLNDVKLDKILSFKIELFDLALLFGFLTVCQMILSFFNLYHSKRIFTLWSEIFDVIKATSAITVFLLLGALVFSSNLSTPRYVLFFWASSSGLIILGRLILRILLRVIRIRGRNLRHLLFVGTNNRALQLARKIELRNDLGYVIIGFVDEIWSGLDELHKSGYKLVADLDGLSAFLKDNIVDEVVISLPVNSKYRQANRVLNLCKEQGIIVRYLTDIFGAKKSSLRLEKLIDDPMICHYTGNVSDWSIFIKRIMDIALSSLLLLVLFPLFLLVALLIKITSPGPVLFIHERMGLNKRRFFFYKFRTMVPDAEQKLDQLEHFNEMTGPVFKMKEDPRVTPIGKFLRKTSIDELPQLFNVLRGDMSLVGPRPLPVRDYEGFYLEWHRRRFSVRPGITCLWQVSGRNDIPFEKWMELDMQYIDQWSLWLDIKILVKTFPAVVKGSGAA
jgi:exopolysaccharide biosynthesis polyprenyl glycosylphosphotransferase